MKLSIGGLLLASALASYAQIIPVASTSKIVGGYSSGQSTTYTGYDPSISQGAVLGSSKAGMDEDLLLMGDLDTRGFVVAWANNIDSASAKYLTMPNVDTTYIGGMAVLRPMQGSAQSALVALRGGARLFVYEIKLSNTGVLSASKLAANSLPASQQFASSTLAAQSRLALISTSTSSSSTQYHLATSDPTSNSNMGRVDFITLDASSWNLIQPYKEGLTGGVPGNMPILGANARLGSGLAPAGDVDGDGVGDLAVLAPASTVNANGALYIVLMQDAHTPKDQIPVIWNSSSYPWREDPANVAGADPSYTHTPLSLSSRDLDQDGRPELLIGETVTLTKLYGSSYLLRAFHVGKDGKIERVSQLGGSDISGLYYGMTAFGPLASWNYSSSSPTLWASKSGGLASGYYSLYKYTTRNTQAVRHLALEAGGDRRKLVGMDSLFHRKGMASTYAAKTLSGLVDCEFSTDSLSCKAPATAKGSWSAVEVTATGTCRAYDLCKTQDTFYVYASQLGMVDNQPRLPARVLSSEGGPLELGPWHRWAYLGSYPLTAVEATIDGVLKSGESPALSFARSATGSYSLTPLAKGIDTLQLTLQRDLLSWTPFKVPMHVALPADLIDGVIPATPGIDTVYSLADGMYLKLPASSAEGALYTYDIEQSSLGDIAEVVGGYLYIKAIDEGFSVTLSYTENKELKTRTLVLSTKAPTVAVASVALASALSMRQVPQGVLIEGMNGDYGVQVLDAQGKRLHTLQGHSTGSLLVPLQGTGLRIVQVYNKGQSSHLKIVR